MKAKSGKSKTSRKYPTRIVLAVLKGLEEGSTVGALALRHKLSRSTVQRWAEAARIAKLVEENDDLQMRVTSLERQLNPERTQFGPYAEIVGPGPL